MAIKYFFCSRRVGACKYIFLALLVPYLGERPRSKFIIVNYVFLHLDLSSFPAWSSFKMPKVETFWGFHSAEDTRVPLPQEQRGSTKLLLRGTQSLSSSMFRSLSLRQFFLIINRAVNKATPILHRITFIIMVVVMAGS